MAITYVPAADGRLLNANTDITISGLTADFAGRTLYARPTGTSILTTASFEHLLAGGTLDGDPGAEVVLNDGVVGAGYTIVYEVHSGGTSTYRVKRTGGWWAHKEGAYGTNDYGCRVQMVEVENVFSPATPPGDFTYQWDGGDIPDVGVSNTWPSTPPGQSMTRLGSESWRFSRTSAIHTSGDGSWTIVWEGNQALGGDDADPVWSTGEYVMDAGDGTWFLTPPAGLDVPVEVAATPTVNSVLVVRRTSAGEVTFWVDGVLIETHVAQAQTSSSTLTVKGSDPDLSVGGVWVYDRALDDDEISGLVETVFGSSMFTVPAVSTTRSRLFVR